MSERDYTTRKFSFANDIITIPDFKWLTGNTVTRNFCHTVAEGQ